MGASVQLFWPGITKNQLKGDTGFFNDDPAWANWIVELVANQRLLALMKSLNILALTTHTCEGMSEKDTHWVAPQELSDAAWSMIRLLEVEDSRIRPLIQAYEKGANQVDPIEQELRQDLTDIVTRSQCAQKQGVSRMTFLIGW